MTYETYAIGAAALFAVAYVSFVVGAERRWARSWKDLLQGFENEEKRKDRLALERYPDYETVMVALRYTDPCGCQHDWSASPPCGWTCKDHMFSGLSPDPYPTEAWRARDLLREAGKFQPRPE